MGNSTSHPLAMMAVARQLRLQRFQIVIMRESMTSFADANGFVNREAFELALIRAKITQNDAIEIFNLLFTMWDHHGQKTVPAKPFAIGIAPLACSCEELRSVLRFSLSICDIYNHGRIDQKGLHDMLISIDNTASYFGDAQLEPGDIDNVVEAVFDGVVGAMPHDLCVRKLETNAYIKRFASGKTRPRVQFKSELELVTEFFNPATSSVSWSQDNTSTCSMNSEESEVVVDEMAIEMEGSSLTGSLECPVKLRKTGSLLDSWDSFEERENSMGKHQDPPPSTPKKTRLWRGFHDRADPPAYRQ